MLSKICCRINAGSGVGKEYLCARLTEYSGDVKYLTLFFTNVEIENQKKQGLKNVQTLNSFFNQHQKDKKLATTISHVLVDEVSMVNNYYKYFVLQLKKKYGEMLLMFGYFNKIC